MFRNPWVTGMIMALMGYSIAELIFMPEAPKREATVEIDQDARPAEPDSTS